MVGYQKLVTKLVKGDRLRILFINDLGFQFGAGLALMRQIQSFLLMGHDVAMLCWRRGEVESTIPLVPLGATGQWLGCTPLTYLHLSQGLSQEQIIENLVLEAGLRYPDVIVLGNLHSAQWSLKLLHKLKALDCVTVAYLHDCYLMTGRCAYTGECDRYLTACNQECPTWQEYPSLKPELIFDEWVLRRELFCGSNGIPLATNSQWMLEMASRALRGMRSAQVVYLGLDEQLFRPIDKTFARQLLGIPQDAFVVLSGAINVSDRRKGGHLFKQVISALKEEVYFLMFGAESAEFSGVHATGLLRDFRKMPLVYSAADVFVGTSLEEAFGQTLCEAAACGLPSVAFNVGGVSEIARHDCNARLVDEMTADGIIREIEFFRESRDRRQTFGAEGRAIVETEFTLHQQGERWINYLRNLAVEYSLGNLTSSIDAVLV